MPELLSLEVVDADGAIREALDEVNAESRADFLKKAIVGGGTFLAGGVLVGGFPKLALGAPSPAQDVQILNFALLLEFLEAEFYTRAIAGGELSGETLRFARVAGAHERAHVRILQKALGGKARKKPRFNFRGTTEDPGAFGKTAQVLEDTGVAAYKGAAPLIDDKGILEAAAGILAVEAYHAGLIRTTLFQRGAFEPTQKISDLRDAADGPGDKDQGIGSPTRGNIVPTDRNGLAFSRTPREVLNIVYLGGGSSGGFFPRGANGQIRWGPGLGREPSRSRRRPRAEGPDGTTARRTRGGSGRRRAGGGRAGCRAGARSAP